KVTRSRDICKAARNPAGNRKIDVRLTIVRTRRWRRTYNRCVENKRRTGFGLLGSEHLGRTVLFSEVWESDRQRPSIVGAGSDAGKSALAGRSVACSAAGMDIVEDRL